jgi:hypothetical protein
MRAHAAGSLGDYKLLVLNGARAKWGSTAMGTGASVTYAVISAPLHTAAAFNCADMVPLDALLASSQIALADFNHQLDAAFAAWSAVANLTFTRVADPAKAQILVGAEGVPGGRAFTNVATSAAISPVALGGNSVAALPATISQSLICLNPEQPWKIGFDGNLNVYDIRYTLMHEIGHAIGLDHPDELQAVMDYHYTEQFSVLQPGDIAGVDQLYGPAQGAPATTVAAAPRR